MSASITPNKIITEFNVSKATLNNWVREGLLVNSKHGITVSSYKNFKNKYLGKTKLNKRANKLYKDNSLNTNITFDYVLEYSLENKIDISTAYEQLLNSSYKNKEGIFYTPDNIIKEIFNSIKEYSTLENTTFLEPSCGTGNYIMHAIENGIEVKNIYAYDSDPIAVEIAKYRVYKKTGKNAANIKCINFLEYQKPDNINFDIIATNPPWGKKTGRDKNREDTFALFFRHAINLASENSIVSMLLPSALSNISSYNNLRDFLLQYSILEIKDYKKVFSLVLENANNYIIKKSKSNNNSKVKCINNNVNNKYNRKQKEFSNNPYSIFNFYTSDYEQKVINHLYSYTHTTLHNNASWAMGIVTGNNSLHISKNKTYTPIYRGINIVNNSITETNEYIIADFDKFQQVADSSLYKAKEKIVYRFITSNLSFAIDDKQRLFLNSANIIIPNNSLGLTNKQIVFLLNSKVMNFIFKKIFNTHKVLKSNIECLPLFYDFFSNYKQSNNYKESNLLDYLALEEIDGKYKIIPATLKP